MIGNNRHALAGHPRPTFFGAKTWMAGTSPAMTKKRRVPVSDSWPRIFASSILPWTGFILH
jgi:hypothetical protein